MNYNTQAQMFASPEEFASSYEYFMQILFGISVENASKVEKYTTLAKMVHVYSMHDWKHTSETVRNKNAKRIYYFSLEFLMGRMLTNNLMALNIREIAEKGLEKYGIDLNELEDVEADAGLGNGGLGRLAACFVDSIATLGYAGIGNTIRYRNGLFKQLIVNNEQVEVPDQWLRMGNPWEDRRPEYAVEVKFYGDVEISRDEKGDLQFNHVNTENILAVPYDMIIHGANNNVANTLRMWSPEPSENLPVGTDFKKYLSEVDDICLNLYPDDSTVKGKYLRIKQEYFFVCAGIKSIIRHHLKCNSSLDNLADEVVIQLNDTHPALAIPEMMRVLMDEYGYDWKHAYEITTHVFAYTNHTVMSEALESWPKEYIQHLLPRIYLIIEEIDRQFVNQMFTMGKDHNFIDSVRIIGSSTIHMANMSVIGSFSVNGVAKIHSEILKDDLFRDYYSLFPEKFSNKTNGITQRRWLFYSNPELTSMIEKNIGDGFKTDISKMEDLMNYVDDEKVQEEFFAIKRKKKEDLSDYLEKLYGITLDPDSIFDVQAKRLHAYKRQLLNVMFIIDRYLKIKNDPNFTMPKTTFIFGAKAASSYTFAKKVIKLINCVADTIAADERVSQFIKVVFIPNYRVTIAEKLMPAADISEQISTAGKEASGTGNMKFMINGAVTLGTMDGANVEIHDLVGDDNIIIFGLSAEEVVNTRYTYNSYNYYLANPRIKAVIDTLTDGTFSPDHEDFRIISDELLLRNDSYLLLADFESYVNAHEQAYDLYLDKKRWARMCLTNIAKAGFFSSDRTIEEYVRDIWHIKKISE